MAEWYYTKGNEKHGPVSSGKLKQLAHTGALLPTDLVWKEGTPDWKPARLLNGLFPEEKRSPTPALPPTPPIPPVRNPPDAPMSTKVSEKWYQHPVTIVISLLFCFPVGLILVWTHPNWPTNHKWIWTGGYAVIMLVFFGLGKSPEPATAPNQPAPPAVRQPVVQQPVAQQPVVQQPEVQQPVIQQPPVHQPVVQQPVAAPIVVTTAQLIEEHDKNEVAFNAKYQDKIVEVTGTIAEVGKGVFGRLYIDLKGKTVILPVTCYFDDSYGEKMANLSKGRQITIRGRCQSAFIIEDCEF